MSNLNFLHSGGNKVTLSAPDSNPSSDVTFKLPQADGSNGQFLKTDGSGALSFTTPGLGSLTQAFRGARESTNYGTDNTVLFDIEYLDEGGNYNPATSVYTVPATGLYIFIAQCMRTASSGNMQVSIRRTRSGSETVQSIGLHGNPSGENEYSMVTCHLVDACQTGDTFRVRQDSGATYGGSVSGENDHYSQFMGYRIA
jgi:hypothetical protein